MVRLVLKLGGAAIALALAACGPGSSREGNGTGSGQMMAGGTMAGREMAMIGGADAAPAECPAIDPKLVAAGRAIFAGPGNCQMCHGANAKGTPLAPDLTDAKWLNVDGSYAAIAGLVRTGVPKPKQYPAPMPPMGGASLAPAQVCAVAAYVYSLGHAAS